MDKSLVQAEAKVLSVVATTEGAMQKASYNLYACNLVAYNLVI